MQKFYIPRESAIINISTICVGINNVLESCSSNVMCVSCVGINNVLESYPSNVLCVGKEHLCIDINKLQCNVYQ